MFPQQLWPLAAVGLQAIAALLHHCGVPLLPRSPRQRHQQSLRGACVYCGLALPPGATPEHCCPISSCKQQQQQQQQQQDTRVDVNSALSCKVWMTRGANRESTSATERKMPVSQHQPKSTDKGK
jgi:hypothetical protein